MNTHKLSYFLALAFTVALFSWTAGVDASVLVPQTALPGDCVPQFAVPMPVFGPAGPIPRVNAQQHNKLDVKMKEFDQAVLPQGGSDTCGLGVTFGKTRVWGYETSDSHSHRILGPANWPAVTVENKRGEPTWITYENDLPAFNPANAYGPPFVQGLVQGLVTTDQSNNWADPFGNTSYQNCVDPITVDCTNPANSSNPCCRPYTGSVPAVPHLHGAETSSFFDGGPDAWFTSDGITGPAYSTLRGADSGQAVYKYINKQEAGTLWFHDHAMGATRTNVYSGLAAFYFLRDPAREPKHLPSGPYEIEMAIQDRQFDTNSQLYFPDGSDALCGSGLPGDPCLNGGPPNPSIHPFWIPEFIGDVVIVNGAPWPYLNVEPRRYRMRLLDGSNARMYNLNFGGTPVYAIGSDDNYINHPVLVDTVFIAPGERADVIVDFSGMAGQTITVTNDAPVPYPSGLIPGVDQPGMANIVRFSVSASATSADKSCNPAAGGCKRPTNIVALTDGNGHLAPGVKIDKVRQLVLKEVEGPGGPIEVMVNNSDYDGTRSPSIAAFFPEDGVSELPRVGSIEEWDIINLTIDAHPMHTHLTQFQVLNRESYNTDAVTGYPAVWEAAFGTGTAALLNGCVAGVFCPNYGPPLDYLTPNADGAIGGNPAVGPYLLGDATPPAAYEAGWKDTAKAMPGQVTRLIIRWAPTSTPLKKGKSMAGKNQYNFDPTAGPGYVWHCHIIDHEDNEMMRPYKVAP